MHQIYFKKFRFCAGYTNAGNSKLAASLCVQNLEPLNTKRLTQAPGYVAQSVGRGYPESLVAVIGGAF